VLPVVAEVEEAAGDDVALDLGGAAIDGAGAPIDQFAHQSGRKVRARKFQVTRRVIADYLRSDAAGDLLERGVIENVLRHLSTVYADHPDFNPSWS